MPRTPLALVVSALALALALPSAAVGHATPAAAEPAAGARAGAPPAEVRLALDAPVEEAFLRLEVTNPDGRPVAGPAVRDPADPRAVRAPVEARGDGSYLVRWRVLSQDGHPSGGAYRFAVAGAPAAMERAEDGGVRSDATPVHVLLRLLAIGWPVLLLGLVALRAAVVGPAWSAAGVAPPGRGRDPEGFRARAAPALEAAAARWWTALRLSLVLGAVGLAGLPPALLWSLRAGPGDLGTLIGETRWGNAWLAQALALLVAAGLAAAAARGAAGARAAPGPSVVLLAAPPALALVAISWAGHAASEPDRALNVAIDAVHNGATAAWLGGLAGLLALLPAATARLAPDDGVRLAAGVVVRFSALAIAAVTTLMVTGAYRALVELGAVADLWDTGYGRALAVKLALFAALLAVGGYNRLVLHPRLERAALGLDPGDRGATAALRASVRAELGLAVLLMASVAALVSLDPPA